MNKFLYVMLHLLKIECQNAILLGYMNISRIMTYAMKVESNNLR